MKRAIVHFFWGAPYLQEAIRAAEDSIDVGVPRIAITDRPTARMCSTNSPFAEVVSVRIGRPSLLTKATLYRHLPTGYDSFLFLDTDTRVLADLSYGFEMAEAWGLAAVMAPHYSLDHFWGFARIMAMIGIPCTGQLQYNTGVLFFSRRADVLKTMQKWENLTDQFSGRFHSDQPFFTLALELLKFNPFTLSPAYNYRAFGEFASGLIRIWHSRVAVPGDVNAFPGTWPPRRFTGAHCPLPDYLQRSQ
jgi:hypothetical protein